MRPNAGWTTQAVEFVGPQDHQRQDAEDRAKAHRDREEMAMQDYGALRPTAGSPTGAERRP